MSAKRKYRLFSTPPPTVAPVDAPNAQLETPQRAAVLSVLYFCQQEGIHCPMKKIEEHFKVPAFTVSRIVQSKRARRLQNSDEPETRGALHQLTNSDANAIASYINDCPFEEKGDTWEDLAHKAGVKPPKGKEDFLRYTIWRRVSEVSGIKSYTAAVKEDHPMERQIKHVN